MNTTQKAAVKKIARLRDKATEQYLEVIEFPISKTSVNKLKLPPSVVSEPGAFGNVSATQARSYQKAKRS